MRGPAFLFCAVLHKLVSLSRSRVLGIASPKQQSTDGLVRVNWGDKRIGYPDLPLTQEVWGLEMCFNGFPGVFCGAARFGKQCAENEVFLRVFHHDP